MHFIFYIWKVMQLTADSLSAEGTSNNDPGPGGDIQTLLQSDSILNWGMVQLPIPRWSVPHGALDTVWAKDNITDTTYHNIVNTTQYVENHRPAKIPLPRIPRLGITLGRDKAVVCYVRALMWGIDAQDWVNPGDSTYWTQPMIRQRYQL